MEKNLKPRVKKWQTMAQKMKNARKKASAPTTPFCTITVQGAARTLAA
jgi:phage terminase Nu1 subunit (DNA packaging protein)